MKSRFTSVDIIAIIKEIKSQYVGFRVAQIYDIDNKTYLIKLSKSGEEGKITLLLESGIRLHITEFEWPKNLAPSGFSMKLRKHIKNRRLESIKQLGSDRIVDLQFGSNEAAYHIIVELYDKGNMILTDHEYTILHLVRPRVDAHQELKFYTKETYPVQAAKLINYVENESDYRKSIEESVKTSKPSDNIRKITSGLFAYGPNLLEHCAIIHGYTMNMKLNQCLKTDSESIVIDKIYAIFCDAQNFINNFESVAMQGFIFGKFKDDTGASNIDIYEDFHPFEFQQLKGKPRKEFQSFNQAVDEYFSSSETQKTDQQIIQKEKAALKKLENIKVDHEKRLMELRNSQETDLIKGELIQLNSHDVNQAILILNHAIANQVSWDNLRQMVKEGQEASDPIALMISNLNFERNEVVLKLSDPYDEDEANFIDTEVSLSENAFENARRYFTMKKAANLKEQKTISSSEKALRSAEIKTKQLLKDVQTIAKINKLRKTHWFEKFNWFISSENYLIVGGKDIQQNELLVKRYLRPGDVYVHADIHGASTVVIKNHEYPNVIDIPPKTLTEAGQMAVVYSSAWESKITSGAWWVRHDQVSKTAPTGEYLTPGSFMIRGKKNYLPVSVLVFGFGILFKISDESIANHTNDRRVRPSEILSENPEETFDDLEEVAEAESSSDDEEEPNGEELTEFPDTKLHLDIKDDVLSNTIDTDISEVGSQMKHKYISANERRKLKKGQLKSEELVTVKELKEQDDKSSETNVDEFKHEKDCSELFTAKPSAKPVPLTKRQQNKLKKIEKKYKDQDEEDRQIRIAVLQGKNPYQEDENLKHLTKKQIRKQAEDLKKQRIEEKAASMAMKQKQKLPPKIKEDLGNLTDDEDRPEEVVATDRFVVNTLTGIPVVEDELMYAIPVLAPYQTLQSYKFKVKMTPGTTKRGKAGKTILFNFGNDKLATTRERELIRALKDQDITRNFPGRVKIYAPNVSKGTKKNK